jgi:thiol:disulfide interchange protein DsbA
MNQPGSPAFAAVAAVFVWTFSEAAAQEEIVGLDAGSDFRILSEPQETSSRADQIEVAELFAYTCIYCYRLESELPAWQAALPELINFVRIPVPFDKWRVLLAQAHYAADSLGKLDEMHPAFFEAIHESGKLLQTREEIAAFFGEFGVTVEAFDAAFDSADVVEKTVRARELTIAYQASATPTIVVNGKYTSSPRNGQSLEEWLDAIYALALSEAPNP